jgi:hypothetical protein
MPARQPARRAAQRSVPVLAWPRPAACLGAAPHAGNQDGCTATAAASRAAGIPRRLCLECQLSLQSVARLPGLRGLPSQLFPYGAPATCRTGTGGQSQRDLLSRGGTKSCWPSCRRRSRHCQRCSARGALSLAFLGHRWLSRVGVRQWDPGCLWVPYLLACRRHAHSWSR